MKIKYLTLYKLATKTILNAKIIEVKGEISNITNLTTTRSLTAVENKIPILVTWSKNKL